MIILISGGSDGLGKAIAQILLPTHTVIIVAPNPEKTKHAALELGCDYRVGDVTDFGQLEGIVQNTIDQYSHIDVLINCAGIWIEGSLESNSADHIYKTVLVNTLGTIFFTKAVLPHFKNHNRGHIINISSKAGLEVKAERSVYSASKWAITGFTRSLELELAPTDIKVTGTYPGKMKTQLFAKAGNDKCMDQAIRPEDLALSIKHIIEMPGTSIITDLQMKSKCD